MNIEQSHHLKKYTAKLIERIGIEKAAKLLGRSVCGLKKSCSDDPDQIGCFLTIDSVAALEAEAGRLDVTSALAAANGNSLSEGWHDIDQEGDLNSFVLALSKSFSELVTAYHASCQSGGISSNAARKLKADIDAMQTALVDVKLRLVSGAVPFNDAATPIQQLSDWRKRASGNQTQDLPPARNNQLSPRHRHAADPQRTAIRRDLASRNRLRT